MARIGLFDDHPAVTQSIQTCMKEWGHDLVFCAAKKDDLYNYLNTHENISVLILDYIANDVSGNEVYMYVNRHYPTIKVLSFTSLSSPVLIENLFKIGIKGYVNKNQDMLNLKQAITHVLNDNIYIPIEFEAILQKLKNNLSPIVTLTAREIEIATLISQQYTSKEIADKIHISVNSVESHRKNIFTKLNVKNVAGMVLEAMNQGFIK